MKKLPAEVSNYFAAIGAKGGQAKVSKGFATLTVEQRAAIAKNGNDAKRRKKEMGNCQQYTFQKQT